jgi:O-antigen/teichoic acid export membrane protein
MSGIILLPILTKNLILHDFGVWGLFCITTNLISMLASFALTGAIYRFLPGETDKGRKEGLFTMMLCVFISSSIISIIIILTSGYIGNFIGNTEIVLILAFITPINCLNQIPLAFFIVVGRMKRYSLLLLLQTYGEIILIAYLIKYGIIGAAISVLIIRSLLFAVLLYFVIREIGIAIPTFTKMREYLIYSLPLIPTRLSSWMVAGSDQYLIAYFLNPAHVGLYTPGYSLGAFVHMFGSPIDTMLAPTVAKLYDENKRDEVKQYLRYSLKYFLTFAIPAMFGLSMLSKKILIILSTREIATNGYMITPFTALSMLLLGSCIVSGQILLLTKNTKVIGIAWMLAAVVNIGLNLFFIPTFGIIGAAATTLIAFMLITAIYTYCSFKYLKFDVDWLFILKSIAASVIMCIVIWYINPIQLVDVLLCIGIGAGIYAAILFLLKGFTREEINFFRELFKI